MTLLEVRQIRKTFGMLTAVSDASLTIAEHEIIGLIGPNGSGKSTLLHTICGRTLPNSGSVILNGVEMSQLPPNKRARAGMAIKFQLARIYLEKSVRDNLLISLQAKNSIPSLLASRSRKAYGEKIESLITEFQLADFADTPARSLSHGQQQWLEIAMAMSDDPVLLLLDEPTAGMSPKERADTAILIRNAAKRCGVLIVEHDLDFIKNLCDRISVLHYGELIATGTPNEIERNDRVREVYLTRV
jgi:branched-chain amino acid transport system ATP-binding protein